MLDILMQTIAVYIPTMALGIHLTTKFQALRLSRKQVMVWGLALGLVVMVFRLLPVPFGWHIPAITLFMILVVRFIGEGRWSMAVLSVVCTQLLGMLGEALVSFPVVTLLGFQAADTLTNPMLFTFASWLANVPLLLVLVGLRLFQRHDREAA